MFNLILIELTGHSFNVEIRLIDPKPMELFDFPEALFYCHESQMI